MPDATITSTASTFGSISGTFAADQSTISGTVLGSVTGTLSGSVGVPGPAGPGLPVGGTEGQIIVKASATDYDTVWIDNAAETLTATVRNETGSTLAAGTVVYISGAAGNKALVSKANASSEATSSKTFAILSESIPNNQNGTSVTVGLLKGLDTTGLTEGGSLWLSTTAGQWTQTMPTAPNHAVFLGTVTRVHANQGTVEVRIQNGYELQELHNVKITSVANGQVLKYDSAQSLWVNGTDSSGVAWGAITGTLSSQTDLQTALDGKYSTTNPSGFITSAALSGYALESWVTTQLGSYLTTSSAASTYLTQSNAASTYQTISGMSSYLTTSAAASTYQTLAGMSSYLTTATAASTYAALAGATFTGKVNTPAATTAGAGFSITQGVAPTSPSNGDIWLTTSNVVARINGTTHTLPSLSTNNTFTGTASFSNASVNVGTSTATAGYSLGNGATISGSTKTLQIGTGGVAGSTTNIAIGSTTGTSTTTLQGSTVGTTLAADTNTTGLATTAFVVGQAGSATPLVDGTAAVGTSLRYARQDHVHPTDTSRAALASPTFTGTPAAPTAAADTNTTQLATTAFVVGQASSTAPVIDGTATVGTSLKYARADHVHPTDTSRAALASPTFTGTPAAPTAAVDTNTTQLATTAYVVGQGYLKSATASSTYAPLASPTFTGTPSLPTGTIAVTQSAGNNTTAVATTAFVTAAVPAFGATADINAPSSTTKAASIANVRDMMLNSGYTFFSHAVGVSGTALSGYYNSSGGRYKQFQNSATSGSYGQWCFDTNGSSIGYAGFTRGDAPHVHNWSKKIWLSGRCQIGNWNSGGNGDTNAVARINLGGKNAFGGGDLTATLRGMGWKVAGGGAAALVLQVTDGSTTTSVTSSFTPTLRQAFDWMLYSDGAGNVTLYVNDSQVATTSAGPTGSQSYGLYMEGVDAIATATAFTLETFGTKIYHGT